MVQYAFETATKKDKEKKEKIRSGLTHLAKIGLYGLTGVSSLIAWYILFHLIEKTTLDPNNAVLVKTNEFGEMWLEYYGTKIIMGLVGAGTITGIGLELYSHFKNLKRKK
ncbi:MAG: hypothetical protein ACFFG0_46225 [Candidatus Thorarchaeota archaeon]